MSKQCELCSRKEDGIYVDKGEITPVEFDGNTFNACDLCAEFLLSDLGEGEPFELVEAISI